MKLIDIEAINWYDDLFLKGVNHSGVWVRYRDVEKLIRNAPIVDAEPVRHVRWIKNDNGTWSCERCHSWIPDEQHYYARFCLYCGAKMDGGADDVCT